MKLRDAKCGDVVRHHAGTVVLFGIVQGHGWVRSVDEVTYREISEPWFLPPDTEVTVVRKGVERFAKVQGGEVDPLRRAG